MVWNLGGGNGNSGNYGNYNQSQQGPMGPYGNQGQNRDGGPPDRGYGPGKWFVEDQPECVLIICLL